MSYIDRQGRALCRSLVSLLALAAVGCSTLPPPESPAPARRPAATAPSATMPAMTSNARSWDEYRMQAARRIVASNPTITHMGTVQQPSLAIPVLDRVTAPTLLIVGSRDEMVLELNRRAQRHLQCENDLAVVPGATHLFEEPGTLAQAARLARDWFVGHLARPGTMSA